MSSDRHSIPLKHERRLQGVLALFRGEPVVKVSTQYRISRSDLYKFRDRALAAMREALSDHPRGPKRPHNRLAPHPEGRVVAFCQRHPTLSSSQVRQRLGPDTPSPRTIQRVRKRHGMARVPKRALPAVPRRRLSSAAKARAAQMIKEKWHLGPERIAWDLRNAEALQISPATLKDLWEGSYDRTSFELTERKKDRVWQLSAHSPRIFGHYEQLAALMSLLF